MLDLLELRQCKHYVVAFTVLYNAIQYNTVEVFKVPSKFAEYSSKTETLTTTHRWLGKHLDK